MSRATARGCRGGDPSDPLGAHHRWSTAVLSSERPSRSWLTAWELVLARPATARVEVGNAFALRPALPAAVAARGETARGRAYAMHWENSRMRHRPRRAREGVPRGEEGQVLTRRDILVSGSPGIVAKEKTPDLTPQADRVRGVTPSAAAKDGLRVLLTI